MNSILAGIYSQMNEFSETKKLQTLEDFEIRTFNRERTLFDDDDFSEEVPQSQIFQKKTINKCLMCHTCNLPMIKSTLNNVSEYVFLCEKCGGVEELIENIELDFSNATDYNTMNNSASPLCITGPNAYLYQKKLICNTSNYKKQQKKNTNDQFESIIHMYNGPKFAKNIVKLAADFYYAVQQFKIMRGDVRKGVMSACLYRICIVKNITRKPKEVANVFGVEQNEFSNGEKILDELFATTPLANILSELISSDSGVQVSQFYFKNDLQINSFLGRYFECLSIPEMYMKFCQSLVKFAIKYRIAQSSIISSKCAGSIYIIAIKATDLQIKRNDIENECKISKSTFGRFSQSILEFMSGHAPEYKKVRSRLRHIFKKNQVPI
jgi:transcription initiation factor TFIIIB Brf1 subunit/transcription initiation factor TFIIB